ncbi:MAG: methyltransferase domain-containing protein [Candidatus Komeilibacteria bacterium]|jgi:SAM-dependent methyltransferase|nr:methyltransferase domain-containing protein [Candidatus Komeilibacteria bacterium]MBT4448021.1 methyltransferase domain-containing protein [Candidatus Komeilibacteria bacterium]
MHSLFRKLTYDKLSKLKLDGQILDLGGIRKADYHKLIKGQHNIKVVNIDGDAKADFSFDLENKFPIENDSYNNIICLNVLEHIFDYQNVVDESFRILKSGGEIINVTPFLLNIHECPNDYWRYTKQSLHKIFAKAGFKEIEITEIGTGLFGAVYQLKFGFFKIDIIRKIFMTVYVFMDRVLKLVRPNSFITARHMPLGFFVRAKK